MAEKHLPVGPLVELSLEQFLALYDEEVHQKLRDALGREGVAALVDFVNEDMWSSRLGDRTAMTVGPGCTYKTVEECEGHHLGDVPSRFKYAKHFVRKEAT